MTDKPIATSEEWREFYTHRGAQATCKSPQWLLDGCPKCGCKTWQITDDCWAYCDGCHKGYSTDFPFTSHGELVESFPYQEED